MARLWAFIGQEGNRQVLGWLGGGAIVVIGGLWAGYTHFDSAAKKPKRNSKRARKNKWRL